VFLSWQAGMYAVKKIYTVKVIIVRDTFGKSSRLKRSRTGQLVISAIFSNYLTAELIQFKKLECNNILKKKQQH